MKTTPIVRVSLTFGSAPDLQLEETASIVLAHLYGNPAFATPPVTEAAFEALLEDFRTKLAAKPNGGPPATAAKNESREALVAKMKELAFYVQVTSDNVLSVLLSSGFQPTSSNRSSGPLAAPVIVKLVHGQAGEALLTGTPAWNARGYERQMALVAADGTLGEWQDLGFTRGARRLSTTGLVAGQRYAFRLRAMGGSTGQSDWSAVAMIMAL
jgi:hypothetical protein